MPLDAQRRRRRAMRPPGHDYTQPGAYFVTRCTLEYAELFGSVTDGAVVLNPYEEIVWEEWLRQR